jgi:hypothetical protein
MMKNPKVFHLGDEMNRKKICNFIECDKVVWFPSYPIVGCQEPEQNHI